MMMVLDKQHAEQKSESLQRQKEWWMAQAFSK